MKLGVHVSISVKIYNAIDRAESLNCETMQIFSSNPRQWKNFSYQKEDIEIFNKKRRASKIDPLFCHTIYLVNLASPEEKIYQDSIHSLISSLNLAHSLNAYGVVTHVGSHMGTGSKEGIARVSAAIDYALYQSGAKVPIILENSAGGGTSIGGDFADIIKIIERVGKKEKVLICLDTAHVYEYGYDITKLDQFLAGIDKILDLKKIALIHLNDSKTLLGSHNDIHENIGKGYIGTGLFREIMNHPRLKKLPAILETPHFKNRKSDINNLEKIRKLIE